jgi:hypothetical protein
MYLICNAKRNAPQFIIIRLARGLSVCAELELIRKAEG